MFNRIIFLIVLFFLIPSTGQAATIYLRDAGGTPTQCLGTTNADYDGSGTGEACAYNHPNWVFPPRGESTAGDASAGDTVIPASNSSFRVGCQDNVDCRDANVNLTVSANCNTAAPGDCYQTTVPNTVTIKGCTTSGCSSNSELPEFWGAGRIPYVLDLTNSTGVVIEDMLITDHAACGWSSPSASCGSADADELSAFDLVRLDGSTGAILTNVFLRGGYRYGATAGYVADLTFDGNSNGATEITYNGAAGINFDTCSNDNTCGVLSGDFVRFLGNNPNQTMKISWNGCIENPADIGGDPVECNSQYGDGFGTTGTSGDWTMDYFEMTHNTSDGLDLKYCFLAGCTVDVRNSHFGGNAGNQFKAAGQVVGYNLLIEGNCDSFEGLAYSDAGMSHCRSLGDALVFNFADNSDTVKLYGITVINMTGNVFFTLGGSNGNECTSSNTVDVQNSIFDSPGRWASLGGGSPGWLYQTVESDPDPICTSSVMTQTYSNIDGASTDPTGTGNNFNDPALSGTFHGTEAAALLGAASPGRDAANETATGQPTTDYNGFARGASYDMGFMEYGSTYTPEGGGGGGSGVPNSLGGVRIIMNGARITF